MKTIDDRELIGGRYGILKPLGKGGIGEVFLATDTRLGNKVVVKFLNNGTTNDWLIKKFEDEPMVQNRVSHPNVAKALDKGVSADGKLYLVMEYIEGENLATFINRAKVSDTQISFEEIAKIIRQIGEGVNAIHHENLVHRDLKPANLMVNDLVKVIDFGIVRDLTRGTRIGQSAGTISYASPEQLDGKDVTNASDIYSIGVIAYTMLTLNLPFNNPHQEFTTQIRLQQEGVKILPCLLRPDLSKEAETLILQALEYDAANRPQSAKEFGDNLAAALTIKPEPQPIVQQKPQANYFKPLFAVASVAVLVLAIVAGWLWKPFGQALTRVQSVNRALERGDYDKPPSYPAETPPQGMNYATVGFTVWRTRPVDTTRDGDDVARDTIEVNDSSGNKTEESSAERINDYITNGNKLYPGIESLTDNFLPNKGGYLYVISREQYADGTFGKAWLLFPNAKTFNGDNLIKTEQPIVLPHQKGRVYQINQSPNQVAETYTIIISPWKFWLPKELEERRTELPKELFADWERQFSENAYWASLRGGVGKPRTKREQKVGSRETIETDEPLTQDDPLPQTVYKSAVKVGNPAMFTVALKFKD